MSKSMHLIDLDLESEKMLDVYKDYVKRTFNDRDGHIFEEMLTTARFDIPYSTDPLIIEFIDCLKHYLHTSAALSSWYVDLSNKLSTSTEKVFLHNLERHLEKVSNWSVQEIQIAFNKAVVETRTNRREACKTIYAHLINRDSGPKIGLLFEKIGKDRLLKYIKSC